MALSHPRREALGRIITRLEGSAESIFRLSARLERMTFNRDLWLKNWRKSEDELTKTEARLKEAEAEVADLKRVLEVVRGQRRGLEAEVVRLKEKDARLQGRLDEVTHTGMKFEDDAKRLRRERDEAERKVKEFADVHGDICMTIARNSEREGMLRAAAAIRAEAAKLREGE